ncbi:MAG: purine-binding chemotaxis protein CheW [Gammaproteobacteria bacterium]|nr:MAG: purine-binding chemotaxis protein CheW [Gammaproteobacteria bacterium]
MTGSQRSPFKVLVSLAQRYADNARGLPAQQDIVATRKVVCFSLLGHNLALPLEELVEIIEIPQHTSLPRVKHWVMGMANLRGRLLPVVNLAAFLGGKLSGSPKTQRVIVIEMLGFFMGLAVDQVQGMRHFKVDTFTRRADLVPEALVPYAEGSFVQPDSTWVLVRMGQLLSDPRFMEVAA